MTGKERILNRLNGKAVDRLPNMCITMTFAAHMYNVPYSKFVTDYKILTDCQLDICNEYGIDLLCAISDPTREAEAFGAVIAYPDDGVPNIVKPAIAGIREENKLKVVRAEEGKRMYDRVLAVQRMHEKAGGLMVAGWVEGAFAEACDILGINEVMGEILDEENEKYVFGLLEKCCAQALEFAAAQVRAGADMIGIGDAACSLISPGLYEKFALPYEIRLVDGIHKLGALTKLHICGNVTHLLPLLPRTKSDITDIDWMVDLKSAVRMLEPAGTAVSGNFDPVRILLQGNTETVKNAVKSCILPESAKNIIAAGCEVPKHTPSENLKAVTQALLDN